MKSTVALALLALSGALAAAAPARADHSAGYRHVCPRHNAGGPPSPLPEARTTLVPPGATSVLLCRYQGSRPSRGRAFALAWTTRIKSRAAVDDFVRDVNALPAYPPGAVMSCPPDYDGSRVIGWFHYRDVRDAPVVFMLGDCRPVRNGYVLRNMVFEPGFTFHRDLLNRTHCVRDSTTMRICR